MIRLHIIFFFSILSGCTHPESNQMYRYNQKSNYGSQSYEPENQINDKSENNINYIAENQIYPIDSLDEEIPEVPENTYENILKMEAENGVHYVWIEINGIKLRFVFDTGASNICISPAEALVLIRQGTLTENDFINTQQFMDATGRISEGAKINLREVRIGETVLENVEAIIVNETNAPLLLGLSALSQFGKIEIDNINNEIIFK